MRPKHLLQICALAATLAAVGLLLAACGKGSSPAASPPALAHARWHVLPAAPVRVDAYLTTAWTGRELIVSGVCCTANDGTLLRAQNVAACVRPGRLELASAAGASRGRRRSGRPHGRLDRQGDARLGSVQGQRLRADGEPLAAPAPRAHRPRDRRVDRGER
jgi:hypothetical protein